MMWNSLLWAVGFWIWLAVLFELLLRFGGV